MTVIEQMLNKYTLNNIEDEKNAIKEIMQEVTLSGLARTDFFKHAAFYGGTALRMFYGLNRFSEDLDFTLLSPSEDFNFDKYLPAVKEAVESLGLEFEVGNKKKNFKTNIKSAFLKGNTRKQFLIFYPNTTHLNQINNNEKIKIKFEIDVNPPLHATTEFKYRLLPNTYQVRIYDKSSLFAGKLHAIIARKWKHRTKGRDFYDFVFYIANEVPVNLHHLEARLKQTMTIDSDSILSLESLKELLYNRLKEIDFEKAKLDVIPFIKDDGDLNSWNEEFFKNIINDLKVKE
ncbi:MAG: nucleotidyl transferase AbiEii/AbiGii toxin family protein [Candidatus Izimaplasma sp.]|nr:nucleotidyl transferase AbiEii/AbiGii toxin family protein [Candidatus Izimaplasma bacterium]